jgi:hypothetical protein
MYRNTSRKITELWRSLWIRNKELRLIHTLGGSGSTLLSRCLAVLPGVALLSEVNPAAVKLFPSFDPLYQDANWLHLLTNSDVERFSGMDLGQTETFRALIQVFYDRARSSNRHLVIRDYNYVEFIGAPYTTTPPRRMLLRDALPSAIPTSSIALIRHPTDQWISLSKHLQPSDVSPRAFCDAYAAFLRELGTTPVFKYEEFIANPEDQFRSMCRHLHLPFAPSFKEDFHQFDGVTGDLSRLRDQSIALPPRKSVPPEVMEEFQSADSFHFILANTGYQHMSSAESNQILAC